MTKDGVSGNFYKGIKLLFLLILIMLEEVDRANGKAQALNTKNRASLQNKDTAI